MTIAVTLTPRQERQLVAIADELGVPMHAVGTQAITVLLESYGHRGRGRVKR